jgi:Polyketide cyclase / dehydrase and lipid transport
VTEEMTAMPAVEAHAPAPGLDPAHLWPLLATGEDLPRLCDQVLEVTPAPGGGQHWRVLLNGSEVDWDQTTTPAGPGSLRFEQVRGDFETLRGTWTLQDGRLGLAVEFHLGVDGLAPLLDPIWTQSWQAFADLLVRRLAGAPGAVHGLEARTP